MELREGREATLACEDSGEAATVLLEGSGSPWDRITAEAASGNNGSDDSSFETSLAASQMGRTARWAVWRSWRGSGGRGSSIAWRPLSAALKR